MNLPEEESQDRSARIARVTMGCNFVFPTKRGILAGGVEQVHE
jgi:hypothetical protein